MKQPENRGRKQDGTFAPGHSGNPRGKRPGTRHKVTLACEELLRGEAEAITRVAIERALEGDAVALRICLDRLFPVPKDAPIKVAVPKIQSSADIPSVTQAVLTAATRGEITPLQADALLKLIEGHRKALETSDLELRLRSLEERVVNK